MADDKHTTTTHPGVVANGVGYDPSEVNAPGVTVFTLVMIGVLLAVFFGVTLYYEKFNTEMVRERVDAAPTVDMDAIRAREAKDLNTYQMMDKSKGVVRIPIEQAMKSLMTEMAAGKGYSTKDQVMKVDAPAGAPPVAGAAATPGAPAAPAAAKPAATAPPAAAPKK